MPTRGRLLDAPLVRAVLSASDAVARGLEREAVTSLARSPYLELTPGFRLSQRHGRILQEARVGRGGHADWPRGFERHRARLRARLAAASPNGPETRRITADLDTLAEVELALTPALASLAALEGTRPIRDHLQALLELMERLQVYRRIFAREASGEAPAPAALARDVASYRDLCAHLRDLLRSEPELGPVPLPRALELLRFTLGESTLSFGQESAIAAGTVRVLALSDLGGLQFDRVIALGLTADVMPGLGSTDPFCSVAERTRLGLPCREQTLAWQEHTFRRLRAAARASLVLSAPALGEGAGEPSPFLARLRNNAATSEASTQACPSGSLSALKAARSPEEKQRALGKWLTRALEPATDASETVGDTLQHVWHVGGPPGTPATRTSRKLPATSLLARVTGAAHRAGAFDPQRLGPSSFEGQLEGAAREVFRNPEFWSHGDQPRRLSPSFLDQMATCSFRALGSRFLELGEEAETEDGWLRRTMGEVVHQVLRLFYEVPAHRIAGRDRGLGWAERARPLLASFAKEELSRVQRADVFFRAQAAYLVRGLSVPLGDPVEGGPGPLRAFLRWEALREDRMVPRHLERRVERTIEAGGVKVRLGGVCDRIDVAQARDENESPQFCVYDYKTGRSVPADERVRSGLSLQLPIYLAAAQASLDAGAQPLAAGYYRLAQPHIDEPRRLLAERSAFGVAAPLGAAPRGVGGVRSLAEVIKRTEGAVHRLVSAMREGRFPLGYLPPETKGCRNCTLQTVCRVDHARQRWQCEAGAPGLVRPLPVVPGPAGPPSLRRVAGTPPRLAPLPESPNAQSPS
jgi:hypothetical protein